MAGNVAKMVNRLSKDLSLTRNNDIIFRRPGSTSRSATVRFSYKAAHDDELDLEVDDVIDVIEDAEAGWMKGKLRSNGRIGLFPTNFVHFIETQTVGGNGISKLSETKKKLVDVSADDSPEAVQRTSLIELSKGRVSSAIAAVETKKTETDNEPDGSVMKEMAKVLFTYSPSHDDELALKEVGSLVTIISKTCADPGWYLGEIDGKRGLIPDNFVEIIRVPAIPTVPPPNVPIKPAKPPGLGLTLGGGGGRRVGTTTSTAFAAMHTTLADALNKPPKSFPAKQPLRQEEACTETRPDERLSHITASRPKQPNKRPPSTVFSKRKSGDNVLEVSLTEALDADTALSPPPTTSTPPAVLLPPPSTTIAPPSKPQSPAFVKSEGSDSEFVSRAEYNRLLQKFEEFRLEMSQRLMALEAKLLTPK